MKKIVQFSLILVMGFALSASSVFAQDNVLGTWVTIDDDGVTKKSVVEIFKKDDGQLYAKVVKLFRSPDEEQNPKCDKCTDDRKDKEIIGMEIIRGMSPKGDDVTWAGGTITDPKNGKEYKCTLWREGDQLMVRGWIGFLFRTQTWVPAE